ncbi:MAG: hypothetical protein WD077_00515 [Bacteroidia bacterium]
MKLIPILFILIAAALGQSCSSTTMLELSLNEDRRDSLEKAAVMHIRQLKQGTLLVRLPAGSTSVKALKSLTGQRGRIDAKEMAEINKRVIDIFHENYDFSSVLFFQSGRSRDFLSGNYENLFLKRTLEPVDTPPVLSGPVYILDIDYVRLQGLERTVDGMQMMDGNFRILSAPFPYFVKYNTPSLKSGEPAWRSFAETVQKLDQNLTEFYSQQD